MLSVAYVLQQLAECDLQKDNGFYSQFLSPVQYKAPLHVYSTAASKALKQKSKLWQGVLLGGWT